MNTKPFYLSKTLWINILAAVAFLVQSQTSFVVDAETQGAIIIVINLIVRIFTGKSLSVAR